MSSSCVLLRRGESSSLDRERVLRQGGSTGCEVFPEPALSFTSFFDVNGGVVATKSSGSKPRRPARATREKRDRTTRLGSLSRQGGAPATPVLGGPSPTRSCVLRFCGTISSLSSSTCASRYFVQLAADGRTGLRAEAVSTPT